MTKFIASRFISRRNYRTLIYRTRIYRKVIYRTIYRTLKSNLPYRLSVRGKFEVLKSCWPAFFHCSTPSGM
jgi:hypothetical protein